MIHELKDWQPAARLRVLAYGKSKVGKTFGAGSFPRPCWLNFDPDGLTTLTSADFVAAYGFRNILYGNFYEKHFKGPIVTRHIAYDDACRFFDEMMKPENRDRFETWVIDSGTTLAEAGMNKAVILLGTPEYNRMSGTQDQALKYGLLMPKIQDWGAERSLTEQFVDMLLATDKHVVFLCHERELRDKEGSLLAIIPALTGQSAENVPIRFSEVYRIVTRRGETKFDKNTHLVTQEWKRVCQTTPDGLAKVGSRHAVPDGTPWHYEAIATAILKNLEARQRQMAAETAPAVVGAITNITLIPGGPHATAQP